MTTWKSANEIFSKTIAFFRREISIDLLVSILQYLLLSFCLYINDGFNDSSVELSKRSIRQTFEKHFGMPFRLGYFLNENLIKKEIKVMYH